MYDLAAGWHDLSSPPRPGTRPPRPVDPAILAEREDTRLRHRERLKRQLAESQVAESRVEELYETMRKMEQKKEQFASDHVSTCAPIQKELALLRQHRVDRIVSGDDADDDSDRRIELQQKIDDANAKLEKQIRDIDETLARLQTELRATAKGIDPTLRNDLTHSASTENRVKMQVFRSRNEFIRRRVDGLSEALRARPNDWLLPSLLADAHAMLSEAERLSAAAVDACIRE